MMALRFGPRPRARVPRRSRVRRRLDACLVLALFALALPASGQRGESARKPPLTREQERVTQVT
jgi:hypothetical protein